MSRRPCDDDEGKLTTVTTVFGLLPLASHLSIDFINRSIIYGGQMAGFWVPLARPSSPA